MNNYSSEQIIGQLEKRKGGYFFLKIDAAIINQFKNKKHTRFICTLNKSLTFQCGLNHLGDGNYFIILSTKNLNTIGKTIGDKIYFELSEDPNPLGVDMPEILEAVLEQDATLKNTFDNLSLGKKRNVIHTINKIKDIDKQIQKITHIINESLKPRARRPL
ncbi:MAG: YdeI/OmpD-associated family protein [Cyclobacteriaceae bacterium]